MSVLKKFIGIERWLALKSSLVAETSSDLEPKIGTLAVFATLAIATTPVVLTILAAQTPLGQSSTLPTLGFGICTVLAILVRWRLKLPFAKTGKWKPALSLTHTAVALGCIPAVFIVLLAPDLLSQRHDLLTNSISGTGGPGIPRPSWFEIVLTITLIAAWVSVVEEILFRGLLVSVLRRSRWFSHQRQRDYLAGTLSALIFGMAHYATWGPFAALALTGLGAGFVIAYIATGEKLLPVVLYHFIFDILSISVGLYSHPT